MASAAINAYGTLLQLGDGAGPEVFTTVGEVTDISGPSGEKETIEVTNHSSPDGYKEYIGGLKDGGEVSFDINFVPDDPQSQALLDEFEAATTANWQLLFPEGSKIGFAGFLTGFEFSAPVDDKLGASLTLKVTGSITLTPAP
jgi:predicted secreted protein